MKSLFKLLIAVSLSAAVLAGCNKQEEAAPAAPEAAPAPVAPAAPVKEEPGGWVPPPADVAPAATATEAPATDAPGKGS